MTDHDSILDRDAAQLELIPSTAIPAAVFEQDERSHTFTGARLFEQDPERYRMIVSLRSEGLSRSHVSKLLRVSRNTIRAVEARESGSQTVDQLKRGLSRRCLEVSRLTLEEMHDRLTENPDAIDSRALPVWLGVSAEKGELLGGRATVRTETATSEPAAEAYRRLVETIRMASETGLGTEKTISKGEAGVGPAPYAKPMDFVDDTQQED